MKENRIDCSAHDGLSQCSKRWMMILSIGISVLTFFTPTSVVAARDFHTPYETTFPEGFPTIDQLTFTDLSRKNVSGEEFLGKAVAIVVFLPSCPRCTGKLPKIEEIRKTFEEEGVTVIGMSTNSGTQDVSRFAQSGKYNWFWTTNSTPLRRQLRSSQSFEIFLFDRLGEIRFHIKQSDAKWAFHFELGLGAVTERALDLSGVRNGYVGSQVCGICHAEQYTQWLGTRHADSIETLVKENSKQKRECLSCHVTGEAGKETLPWRITPREMQEVGCEECHGAGGPHRTQPHVYRELHGTDEASCVRCHDQENSPNWNYEEYLKKVVHDAPSVAETGNAPVSPDSGEAPKVKQTTDGADGTKIGIN